MIYPFTVISSKKVTERGWGITIERSEVVKYEPALDPNEEFKYPVINKCQEFHYIEADSEDEALEEIAKNVAVS